MPHHIHPKPFLICPLGVLYQGGAELAFERPTMTRDMIVIMQALVILFTGALEHLFRPALLRIAGRLGRRDGGVPAPGRSR